MITGFFFHMFKYHKFYLFAFNDSLFTFSQPLILFSSSFIFCTTEFCFWLELNKPNVLIKMVSSAYVITLNSSVDVLISFIYYII